MGLQGFAGVLRGSQNVFEVAQGRFRVSGGSIEDPEVLMGISGGRRNFSGLPEVLRGVSKGFQGVLRGTKRS